MHIPYLLKRYFQEVAEAIVSLTMIKLAINQKVPCLNDVRVLVKASLLMGLMTLILEEINPDLRTDVKRGISTSVGATIVKSI